MRWLLLWILNAVALLAVAYLMPSIQIGSFAAAMGGALVLGLVNAVIRPILLVLTLPVTLLTLGFFIFIVNGLMFWLAGSLFAGFQVGGFWAAVFGAIIYSLISWALTRWLAPQH